MYLTYQLTTFPEGYITYTYVFDLAYFLLVSDISEYICFFKINFKYRTIKTSKQKGVTTCTNLRHLIKY